VTDDEIQQMLKQELMRNSLTDESAPAILDGSGGGLLLSKEEVEKTTASMSSTKFMNSQGEIRSLKN
jgi:hypothetical protein